MGDCLLLTSPVRVLKQHFPRFKISIVVEARFAGCFDANPDFDEIIVLKNKFSAAAALLTRRFDAIINLHGGPTSLLYTWLAWGPKIGSAQFQYCRLYSGVVTCAKPQSHSVEATMHTLNWLGVKHAETPPALRYEFHPVQSEKVKALAGIRDYVVMHPGALQTTKRWEARRFAKVAQFLQSAGWPVIFTGGPGDEPVVMEAARDVAGSKILLGLTIPELAELIRAAKLYIGNDSGPMHLASAVGTPVVAIWGSSNSRLWRPWSVASRVVQNPFECNPCPGYRCLVADTPLCIESVTVEQVVAAAKELLK
jgi:ADP-heptose:LPS heptosyltransferase